MFEGSRMKFGIIGAGMIAKFHAQAIHAMADGELVSVYGRRPDAATDLGKELGCRAFSDLDEFLSDPGLDIVTIATPIGRPLGTGFGGHARRQTRYRGEAFGSDHGTHRPDARGGP